MVQLIKKYFVFIFALGSLIFPKSLTSQETKVPYYKAPEYKILSTDKQLVFTDSLYKVSLENSDDELFNITLKQLVKLHYRSKNWKLFNNFKDRYLELSKENKDTLAVARTYEYVAAYMGKIHHIDSSYYYYTKSYLIYEELKDSLDAGLMLINLAIIQKNMRDFAGSEVKSLKALSYLKKRGNKRRIASIYNNLGIVNNNLKNYDSALKYHNLALNLRKELDSNSIYVTHSLNNIGKIYKDRENYDSALAYFNKGLKDTALINKYPKVKATLLDNLAHSRLRMGEQEKSLNDMLYALQIRENENDQYGIIKSSIHLAEYYNKNDNGVRAVEYAERAEAISKDLKEYQDYLESLEFMMPLYTNDTRKNKFKKYVVIRDSLELSQKKNSEAFAKIDLQSQEKDKLISKKDDELSKGKMNRIVLLIITVLMSLLIGVLFFVKRKQNQKLKKSFFDIDELKNKLAQTAMDKHSSLSKDLNSFHSYIKQKYTLTDVLLEYWILRANRKTKKEIASELHVSENSVADRRKRLMKILKESKNIGEVSRSFLVDLYSEELSEFLKPQSKS